MGQQSITTAPDSILGRPTRVRFFVVALATLMAFLLYLDRFCLSFTERYIKEDLGLSNNQAGWMLSAFFWAYALAQVPSGWLSDRFGARAMLALYILLWSLFTGLMGLAFTFAAVLVLRFACGLAQAGAYPTSAGMVSKWVPFSARGLASGIISFGGRIGGAAAPVLTAYLMVAFVPIQVDPLLQPADVLNPRGLGEQLLKPGDKPSERLSATLRDLLPEPAMDAARACAATPPGDPVPAEQTAALADGINAVLKRRDLFTLVNLNEFALPSEARDLAAIPPEQLTEREVERRNRLLLEAAYPDEIRKLYGVGWRPVMLVYGAAGLLVAALFWLIVRDRPQQHPRCNSAELALIESGRPAAATSPHGRVGGLPVMAMLRSRSLWLSSISQFGTNFGWVFILTLFPRYLTDVHRVPILERGWMATTPVLVGMIGMLSGGWVTDRLTRRLGLRWGRRLPMASTRFLAMAAFLACVLLDLPWPVTVALCVAAVATDLGTASVWAFKQDIGGRHVGSVLGWGNMWGNFGAALSPVALNYIIGASGWNACFLACATAFLVAGVAAMGVDATVPIQARNRD